MAKVNDCQAHPRQGKNPTELVAVCTVPRKFDHVQLDEEIDVLAQEVQGSQRPFQLRLELAGMLLHDE
jgi:hypothetical protein